MRENLTWENTSLSKGKDLIARSVLICEPKLTDVVFSQAVGQIPTRCSIDAQSSNDCYPFSKLLLL